MKPNTIISMLLLLVITTACNETTKTPNKKAISKEAVKAETNDTILKNTNVGESVKSEPKNPKSDTTTNIPIPDFYDYESEYQFRYEYYIDKAYSREIYEKQYKPNTYQSKHLDSLITLYEQKMQFFKFKKEGAELRLKVSFFHKNPTITSFTIE